MAVNEIATLQTYKNTKEFFYDIRGLDRDREMFNSLSDVKRAARFIYLNKTCFNGLYRENSRGEFNVSFGNYAAPNIVNADVLYAVRDYLNQAQIHFMSGDFGYILENLPSDSFVYFDPHIFQKERVPVLPHTIANASHSLTISGCIGGVGN